MARLFGLILIAICCVFPRVSHAATYWLGASSYGFQSAYDACKSRLDGAGYQMGSVSGMNCLDSGGAVRSIISTADCSGVLKKGVVYLGLQTYSCAASCPNGVVAVDGYCSKDCAAQAPIGSSSTKWSYSGGYPGYGGGYCIGGCSYDLHGSESYDKSSNMSSATGTMKPFGTSCSTASTPKTDDPSVNGTNPSTVPSGSDPSPSTCSEGQVAYKGFVNGESKTVCGAATKSSSTGAASGSTSSSTTTNNNGTQTTTNSTGTSSKTTKTTCENGQCTTTTSSSGTTGGGSGTSGGTSSTGSETKTDTKENYCKDNPTSKLCTQTGNGFGGGCGSFWCEGDAVQCATARATQELLCKFDIASNDSNLAAGQSAAAGGTKPSGHPINEAEDKNFSLSSLVGVQPMFGASGQCIADKTVPMLGKTLTIPFSRMCTALELLGYAFLACCYISAAYIVFAKKA